MTRGRGRRARSRRWRGRASARHSPSPLTESFGLCVPLAIPSGQWMYWMSEWRWWSTVYSSPRPPSPNVTGALAYRSIGTTSRLLPPLPGEDEGKVFGHAVCFEGFSSSTEVLVPSTRMSIRPSSLVSGDRKWRPWPIVGHCRSLVLVRLARGERGGRGAEGEEMRAHGNSGTRLTSRVPP